MKSGSTIAKIVAAVVVLAGIAFIVATYGDKIVAWTKRLLGKCDCNFEDYDCEELPTEAEFDAE